MDKKNNGIIQKQDNGTMNKTKQCYMPCCEEKCNQSEILDMDRKS